MPTPQETLLDLGLSPATARIYLVLIEHGTLTPSALQQETKLSRVGVHDALNELLADDLVEYKKVGRHAFYSVSHPQNLETLLNQKKRDIALLSGETKETIRTLVGAFNLNQKKPGIRYFEGREELKEIYEETLERKQPVYAILSPNAVDEELRTWLDGTYTQKRVDAHIPAEVIVASDDADPYHTIDTKANRKTTLIPRDQFPVDIEIDIFGTREVAFISYSPEEMVGFIIDSPAVHKSMKSFFKLAALQAKQIADKSLKKKTAEGVEGPSSALRDQMKQDLHASEA